MTETPDCADVRALLPELAAGVAGGDARARAMAHLSRCPACRRELEETTAVIDSMLQLTPERDPPAGFEQSVLATMNPGQRRSRRPATVLLGIAASVLVAALAAGLVWWQTADDRQLAAQYRRTLNVADGRYLAAADISTAVDSSAGHAFAYEGSPSWLYITVDSAPASGVYQVQLVTTDNRTIDVGRCQIVSGKGSWGWTLEESVGDIARIQLLRSGVPTMSARFNG